ncbi:MAG TPA: transcriptional regulator [Acidimicrobiaceae bacterium]|jgi:DNA-binding HxlR family transcriptional regulator|nr:transcriptional regulator [Actinomycetota bacterium]NCG40784.1 transcriptional regulator [Actinomycetota bacterium]HAN07671.1 transcriptional regulator [Acidimicrobiaceae bacterium]
MVKRKSFSEMDCPIAQCLEVVGEWWSPLILRNVVIGGMTRFDQIQRDLSIAPNVLTDRLATLVEGGLLERNQYSTRPPRFEYLATEAGKDFKTVLDAMCNWGTKWGNVPK